MDSVFYGNRLPNPHAEKPFTGERASVSQSGVFNRNSFEAPRQSGAFVPPIPPRAPSVHPRAPSFVVPSPVSQVQPMRQSLRLSEQPQQQPTCLGKYCAWTTIKYYKPYFNVTSPQVIQRLTHSLKCWSNTFFAENQPFDLYGPFWIYTTLAFILSAVSNILRFQVSKTFGYDFEVVATALGMVYILGFVFPTILAFIIRCHTSHPNATYTSILCLYGYSQTIFIICIILCSINLSVLHWVLIGFATFSRTWWILMNVNSLDLPAAKRVLIIGFILGEAALYFLIVKFYFIKSPTLTMEEKVSHYRIRHYGTSQWLF